MTRLGDYEVLRALKSGGMGDVLLARRRGPEGFERLVAIKTIRPELAGAANVRAMFLDEARLLARLVHPAIAQVSDFGEEAGGLYLVMEYVPGIRFRELAERRPPPAIAARAVAEAARGVHAAHELRDLEGHAMGVVHRDLSPDNLILGWDGQVKVIDFGIALVKGRQAPVTEVGTLKGKPPYMSPEQVKNEAIDRRADVWALGLVLHELLTGEPVFDGDSIYAVARSVVVQEIRPPSAAIGAAMPAGLDAAVMGALERELDRRTATAGELADRLDRVAAATGGEALASWTARELAADRDAHRKWLSSVVARATGARAAMGRPTGVVTAISLPAPAEPEVPAAIEAAKPEPVPEPDLDEPPPRRSRAWMIVVLLCVLLAIAAIVIVATHGRGARGAAAPADAKTIATITPVDAPVITDAPIAAPAITDAPIMPETIDAQPASPDARMHAVTSRHPDAQPSPPPARPDAQPASAPPPPSGTGHATFTADPFATILVDGHDNGSTPRFNVAIPAGRHHVQLVNPETGAVRYDRTLDVHDGDHIDVRP